MASGSAGNCSKPGTGIGRIVGGDDRVKLLIIYFDLCGNSSNPASISVNDTTANSNPLWKAKLIGGLLAQCPDAVAGIRVVPILVIKQH